MSTTTFDIEALAWDKQDGLLPAIVQDAATLRVLMLGYMDRAALAATLASGQVTFYSRSKQRLWIKGVSSGHVLALVSVDVDCDADTLLVQARPHGPTCHLDRASCFPGATPKLDPWSLGNALFSHLICVGLPIALIVAWRMAREPVLRTA